MDQHKITTELCSWMHRATRMQQELFTTFQEYLEAITLKQDEDGAYDVYLNSWLFFSRKKEGRFPEIKELNQLIRHQIESKNDLVHRDSQTSLKS